MTEAKIQNLDTLQRSVFQYNSSNIPIPRIDFNSKAYAEAIESDSTLYTIMSYKAKKTAQIKPILAKEKDSKAANEYLSSIKDIKDGYTQKKASELRKKAFEEVPLTDITDKNPLYKVKKLLTKPNANQTFSQLMYSASMNFDNGALYFWGVKLNNGMNKGQFQTLEVLPTHLIEIIRGANWMTPISGYRFNNKTGEEFTFQPEDVIAISSYSPRFDMNGAHLHGTSKIKVAWDDLQVAKKANERKYTNFSNGDLRIIITPEAGGAFETGNTGSETWLKDFWNMIQRRFKQPNSQRAAVLDNPITVHQIQNAIDGDLITNAEEQALRKACSVWGLEYPVLFPSLKGTAFENQKDQVAKSLRNGVFPELQMIEENLREYVVKPMAPGHTLLFDYDVYEELNKDIKAEIDAIKDFNALSMNEKRERLDYERIDDPRADIPESLWDFSTDLNFDDAEL